MASGRDVVVVIGAGLSGLAAAAILARRGRPVRIVEAGGKVGGCCATTRVGGYTFHDGALFVALRGLLARVFERAGLDLASAVPMRPVGTGSVTYLPGEIEVSWRDGPEIARAGRPAPFDRARARAELQALERAWDPMLRALSGDLLLREPSALRMLGSAWRLLPRLSRTVASELGRTVTDPALRAAIAGATLFGGVPPERAPAAGLLGVMALWRDGAHLPVGGMGRIPEALAEAVRRSGGEILLESPVERIAVERGRVRGVEVLGGARIEAGTVVSTVSALATLGRLLAPDAVPRPMARRARRATRSHRAVSIQLGLRNRMPAPAFEMRSVPYLEEQGRWFGPGGDAGWLSWFVPSGVDPSLAPPGGSVVEAFPAIDQGVPADAWDEARTAGVVERVLRALSSHASLDVAVTRVRGPRDFARQMRLDGGEVYGLSPATSPLALFRRYGGIPGLLLAGQTTYPGFGVATSAASGLLAAEAVLASDR